MKRLIGILVLLAACGDAPGKNYATPLVTLSGTISSGLSSIPSNAHLAIVWSLSQNYGDTFAAIEALAITPVFPASFTADIHKLPTMNDHVVDLAWGHIVVYEDQNGNGVLDLLPTGAPTTLDHILGVSDDYLWFSKRQGWAVWQWPTDPLRPKNVFPQQGQRPIETPIPIALSDDPWLRIWACEDAPEKPKNTWRFDIDYSRASNVTCTQDGGSFTFEYCYEKDTGCTVSGCVQHTAYLGQYFAVSVDRMTGEQSNYCEARKPEDWPCTVTIPAAPSCP